MENRPSATQRGYDSDWQQLRKVVLAEEPLCRLCKKQGNTTPATVVDHIKSIDERPDLRLVRSNLQPLCKPHHDSEKQSEESLGYSKQIDESGWPTDPRHPFWGKR